MAPPQAHSHTSYQPNTESYNAELRSIYLDFLRRMCFINSVEACSPDTRHQIDATVTALCGSYVPAGVIACSSGLPALINKLHPVDHQVKIAHFTALAIHIDDLSKTLTGGARDVFLEDLALFQMKMCDPQGYAAVYPGRGDLHRVLEDFMHYLRTEQNPYFPSCPRTLTVLVKSSFDFLEGNLLEQHYEAHPINYMPEMHLFCRFLRGKSGVAEVYASFVIWDDTSGTSPMTGDPFYYNNIHPLVPELDQAFNLINDVLSFYKEADDGETATTVIVNAKVKQLSPLDSLRDVIEFLVDQRNRVMKIVEESGSLEWKRKIQQFYQGYLAWHIGSHRYRFKQLLGDWYQGEYWS